MRHLTLAASATLSLLLAATWAGAANATILLATVRGTVGYGRDYSGFFFPKGANFTGASFTMLFVTDDATPGAFISLNPPSNSSVTSQFTDGATKALVELNGKSFAISGDYSSSLTRASRIGTPYSEIYINSRYRTESYDNFAGIDLTSNVRDITGWDYRDQLDYVFRPEYDHPGGGLNFEHFVNGEGMTDVEAGFNVQSVTISNPGQPVFPTPGPGEGFQFDTPMPGKWFDPPAANGFEYALNGGGEFTTVGAPPASYGFGTLDVVVNNVIVDTLNPGDFYFFDPGVTDFFLKGISPAVDSSDPSAFPTYLDFSGSPQSLTMTPLSGVPEPATWVAMLFGFAVVGGAVRRAIRAGDRNRTPEAGWPRLRT